MPVAILPIERPAQRPQDGFVLKRIVDPQLHHQAYGGDEDDYIDYENPSLIYTNEEEPTKERSLVRMNVLRRERESCDVVLFVAEREILAHRSVLSDFSPTLAELIQAAESQHNRARDERELAEDEGRKVHAEEVQARRPLYLEFPSIDFDAFDALVNYAYTSQLEVSEKKVAEIYNAACFLRVDSAAKVAAKYLAENLSPSNAIGVRKCANKTSDSLLTAKVDAYIQEHFTDIIASSPEFVALPCVQVEVIGDWGDEEAGATELATRVLAWFQSQPIPEHRDFRLEAITQSSHLLYLDQASVLRDCCDIEDTVSVSNCDIVLDYRAKKKNEGRDGQLPPPAATASLLINPAGPMPQSRIAHKHSSETGVTGPLDSAMNINHVSSVSLNLANLRSAHMSSSESLASLASSGNVSTESDEVQWNVVAVARPNDHFVIALAIMHQRLVSLSIQIINSAKQELRNGRSEAGTPLGSPTHSPTASPEELMATMEAGGCAAAETALGLPLPSLSRSRCSHGLIATSDGRLLASGGYDRGECLSSLEELALDAETGLWLQWCPLPPMQAERGRFDAVNLDDRLYAIGGSNGTRDLDTVEIFDPATEAWSEGPRMLFAKSNHGCVALEGKIYCIGGWNGSRGISEVEVLEPSGWRATRPLSMGRYQAGCTAWEEGRALVVAGGCESWGCLASVEMLRLANSQDEDEAAEGWIQLPELAIARRGCGVAIYQNKLYVIGGTDGQKSLTSVEVLDLTAPGKGWSSGPALQTPRANVRAARVGERLVVVGGFSGKIFLPTMEYLDFASGEWKTVQCKRKSTKAAAMDAS